MDLQTFTTNGTFTPPVGILLVDVEAWGAGGSGAGATDWSGGSTSGGGAGAYSAKKRIAVVPGTPYPVVVGVGGLGVNGSSHGIYGGNPGSDSYFIDIATLLAKAGQGGDFSSNTSSGGLGGQAADGVGDTKYSGGRGGQVGFGGNAAGASGGGGAAGRTGDGSQAPNPYGGGSDAGGAANPPGGDGGRGNNPGTGNGANGNTPGGGGGSKQFGTGDYLAGYVTGAGARGEVRIQASLQVVVDSVASIGYTEALVTATAAGDGGSTITERGVVYSTTPSPTVANNKVPVAGAIGSYSAPLTGLTPATHYYVRAYVINANETQYSPVDTEFDTTSPPSDQMSLDIEGVQGAEYGISITVGGTVGSVTVQLGSTGTSQVISAGAGTVTFEGIYGGTSGLLITGSATFNGTVDNVFYYIVVGTTPPNWANDSVASQIPIASSVLFRRIEDKDFNRYRTYRYLDILFKNLNGYVTTTIKQESADAVRSKTTTYLVNNPAGTDESPFIKKRISFLSKNQAILIGVSNANLNDTFTIAAYDLRGHQMPPKLFSKNNIISVS